jgi:hypothetical protein
LGVSGGTSRGAKVTLSSLETESLDALYVDPSGACATDDSQRREFSSATGKFVRVLSQAMRAGTIEISEDADIKGQLGVDVANVGGASVEGDSSAGRTWTGTKIFFADFATCFNVKHETTACTNLAIGPGNTCDLTPCTFQATSLKSSEGTWGGTLSCPGYPPAPLEGTLGQWIGKNTTAGVTYNVRLKSGSGINSINVEIDRWDMNAATSQNCSP